MALVSWGNQYSVGVKAIDAQHATLFAVLNELHAAMMKGNAMPMTGPLLRKLVSYTHDHFAAEEKLIAEAKYPGLAGHKAHHRDLIKKVEEFMARHERGDATVNIALLRFLSEWLTGHIQHEDQQYSPWMKEHGVH